MTAGPYPPDHGTVPTEVTVTRDGDHVVVCGVRLSTEAAILLSRKINSTATVITREAELMRQEAVRELHRRMWLTGAVAVAELPGGDPIRLLPDGRIDARGPVWYRDLRSTLARMLVACPTPRRLWWVGSRGMRHLDGCGCWHNSSLSDARLLPADERPAKVCKRSLRKLAAEVTP